MILNLADQFGLLARYRFASSAAVSWLAVNRPC
jgi:hypothetical protein